MATVSPLLNERVLRLAVDRHIRDTGGPSADLLQTVTEWHDHVSRGLFRSYSETQLEQTFLQAFFVELLGYVPVGRGAIHHLHPKRTSARGRDIPDFVLGYFDSGANIERWIAVGELKAIGTNLDYPQTGRYSYETPVQQAFRCAMHGRPGVEWIILSNFTEIRLYRNGYVDAYREWSLEELTDPIRLAEFCLLLARESLIVEQGVSPTLDLLNKSVKAGLRLAEGFYGLYGTAKK